MKEIICYLFGHKWDVYAYGSTMDDPGEMAGNCSRCNADTHEYTDTKYRFNRDDVVGTWWRGLKRGFKRDGKPF